MSLNINEIFNSLDGEVNAFDGIGQPTTFIRLQGCNLNCAWCDTKYAQLPYSTISAVMSIEQIVQNKLLRKKITITGGEPLLQPKVWDLMEALRAKGYMITLETNGSIVPPKEFSSSSLMVRWVVDYKMPSSGMEKHMKPEIFERLNSWDVVKFVVKDMMEYRAAKVLLPKCRAKRVVSPLLPDTCPGAEVPGWAHTLAQQVAEDGEMHFSLQLHKVLGIK